MTVTFPIGFPSDDTWIPCRIGLSDQRWPRTRAPSGKKEHSSQPAESICRSVSRTLYFYFLTVHFNMYSNRLMSENKKKVILLKFLNQLPSHRKKKFLTTPMTVNTTISNVTRFKPNLFGPETERERIFLNFFFLLLVFTFKIARNLGGSYLVQLLFEHG